MQKQPKQPGSPGAPVPKRSATGKSGTVEKPRPDEREAEAEAIDLERAMREANRPIPGTLGGDFKP